MARDLQGAGVDAPPRHARFAGDNGRRVLDRMGRERGLKALVERVPALAAAPSAGAPTSRTISPRGGSPWPNSSARLASEPRRTVS